MTAHDGACLCGNVRLTARGDPLRVGLCHCLDCRKESGSAFTYYGVWPADRVEVSGETRDFRGQSFCPACGARLFAVDGAETEIKLGALSPAPVGFAPSYELWVRRREPWLRPIAGAAQFEEDRT